MRRIWRRFLAYRAGVLAAAYVLMLVLVAAATPLPARARSPANLE